MESRELFSSLSSAVLSINILTNVKPRFISRGKLGNVFLNTFLQAELHDRKKRVCILTAERWLV